MNNSEIQPAAKTILPDAVLLYSLCLGVLLFLAGCSSMTTEVTGFDQVTVKPGQTAQCESRPCTIMLVVPAGSGTVEVTGNQEKLGDYAAGQTSDVGSFWQSQVIEIKGSGLPAAYVNIPAR